jgi:hypothetical protein
MDTESALRARRRFAVGGRRYVDDAPEHRSAARLARYLPLTADR